MKNILIGGQALVNLCSSRGTSDTDYLVNDTTNTSAFIHDTAANIDYLNANGNKFFAAIYEIEEGNEQATPQSLLELKAYAFAQHCRNFYFQKADDAEYDIKFLVRKFGLKGLKTANKFLAGYELEEINKIIRSVK